jgi:ABC-type multidrug transport system ATPase subunit
MVALLSSTEGRHPKHFFSLLQRLTLWEIIANYTVYIGNPTVLLLDEPSSGMDAASKRVMWRTLASVVPGRSLVLTTQ